MELGEFSEPLNDEMDEAVRSDEGDKVLPADEYKCSGDDKISSDFKLK